MEEGSEAWLSAVAGAAGAGSVRAAVGSRAGLGVMVRKDAVTAAIRWAAAGLAGQARAASVRAAAGLGPVDLAEAASVEEEMVAWGWEVEGLEVVVGERPSGSPVAVGLAEVAVGQGLEVMAREGVVKGSVAAGLAEVAVGEEAVGAAGAAAGAEEEEALRPEVTLMEAAAEAAVAASSLALAPIEEGLAA